MRLRIPFPDALLTLHAQMVIGVKINAAPTVALQDAAPLFDWIHPRAMHGRAVHHTAGMRRSLFVKQLATEVRGCWGTPLQTAWGAGSLGLSANHARCPG
jgi:hypothetical protein